METTKRHRAPAAGVATHPSARAPRDRELASLARDDALTRLGRTRRWVMVGAVALSGALAGLASALLPGKSLGASSRARLDPAKSAGHRSRKTSSSAAPALAAPASAAQLGVQGSGQQPQGSGGSEGSGQSSSPPAASTPPSPPAPAPSPPASQPAPSSSSGAGATVSGGS